MEDKVNTGHNGRVSENIVHDLTGLNASDVLNPKKYKKVYKENKLIKYPSCDMVLHECIKLTQNIMRPLYVKYSIRFLIPSEWQVGLIVPLYKN